MAKAQKPGCGWRVLTGTLRSFQPVYHPWVDAIVRLWMMLHDTLTRYHRHWSMKALLGSV